MENIRLWLRLVEQGPRPSRRILSALTVHLALFGIFIKDTDLFFRDVTRLLNGPIAPVYNLVKQLCRLFPVYFHEIGAEGELRDVSTRIDELARRRDPLVHYLRKQSHVESSPQTVVLMEAIFAFWETLDPAPLTRLVPADIWMQIEPDGPFVRGMHAIVGRLRESGAIAGAAPGSRPWAMGNSDPPWTARAWRTAWTGNGSRRPTTCTGCFTTSTTPGSPTWRSSWPRPLPAPCPIRTGCARPWAWRTPGKSSSGSSITWRTSSA